MPRDAMLDERILPDGAPADARPAGRMRAHAQVGVRWQARRDGPGSTRVTTLREQAPLLLRMTRPKEPEPWPDTEQVARVSVTAGAAGPIGGDAYRLDVEVGAGATLVLGDVSPTLLLPGPRGGRSSYTFRVRVDEGGTLIWLAEPVIASARCNHRSDIAVDLHPTARLVLREELVLGRHGERCGAVRQRLTVRRGGATLHRQDVAAGPGAAGYDGAAVIGAARAVGSVLVVDPRREGPAADTPELPESPSPTTAVFRLDGPAALVSAVAPDNLALRHALRSGLDGLGPPWARRPR